MNVNTEKVKIGISSCLLGEKVRFDGGHKKNAYILGVLGNYFEFLPFCPEVNIGLGIPRESIRLVSVDEKIHCVGMKTDDLDVTDALYEAAEEQKGWHADLCGYILKRDSPSCGMERVKVYKNEMPERKGVGLYAKRLMENFPHLPVEEEGRLEDPHLRENFIQRVYIYSRWRALEHEGMTLAKLQAFHAAHKYIFMSHGQLVVKELGALLAGRNHSDVEALASLYLNKMMPSLKIIATRNNHVNTLQHIQGYLKNEIDAEDKQELLEVIGEYHQGRLPLIVPITLLRHHFRKHQNHYIMKSFYMSPHPGELMLLNNI